MENQQKPKVKYRISSFEGYVLMASIAGTFDIANGLLGLIDGGTICTWIISSINWLVFFLWFQLRGQSYTKNAKMTQTFLIGLIWGYIPIINILPEYTAAIIRMVLLTRAEDREKSKKMEASQANTPQPQNREAGWRISRQAA